MRALVFVLCFLAGFAGCAVPPPPVIQRQATFIEAEYAPYAGEGDATITGQAFLKTRGGDVKYGAGCVIGLNPVTTYSSEWFQKVILEGLNLSPRDERAVAYHREMMGDGEGRFRFEKLPAGEYYLTCWISWEVDSGYRDRLGMGSTVQTGGVAYAQVRVGTGETVNVIVTR